MGCIEIAGQLWITAGYKRLIETWDVLKFVTREA